MIVGTKFGNVRDADNSTVVTAARLAGSGTLQGTLARTAVSGVASYTDLSHNVTDTITIQFTATNLISVTSSPIVVGPGPATRLDVQVNTPAVRHEVTVQQIQRWLKGASISPNEMVRKAKLKAMLGQM